MNLVASATSARKSWTRRPITSFPDRCVDPAIVHPHVRDSLTRKALPRPIRAEARDRLLRSIAQARSWLSDLTSGMAADTDETARRERKSERSIRMLLSLAFVAPDIVTAAIHGRLPRGFGMSRLIDLPIDWAEQRKLLGLPTGGLMCVGAIDGGRPPLPLLPLLPLRTAVARLPVCSDQPDFFTQILHQPFGRTVPSTDLQEEGAWKREQFTQL
jgi:hypothetical protein